MNVSTLSSYELANIVGQYHGLDSKDTIDPRLLTRGYTPEQLEILKKKTITNQTSIVSCGLSIHANLKEFRHEAFHYYLTSFHAYDKHNQLPFPGSYNDQPAKIMEVFEILEQLKFEAEERAMRKHEREQRAKQNGR
jgi:hypothetical protein